ncbi:MAG: hypothetical protein R2880_07540 [Deinococcales bacterium]
MKPTIKKALTLSDLFAPDAEHATINLILRADTQGSLEALKGVIAKESAFTDEVDIQIMLDAVGAPTGNLTCSLPAPPMPPS